MEKLRKKTVMIVDDEESNVFALGSYLENMGMNIVTAQNGAEAIALLEGGINPDVILLDMMMPVMDGYESLDLLRNDEKLKHIPVFAVTARVMKGDRERCLEAGAWEYISKPIDVRLLVDKIATWVK